MRRSSARRAPARPALASCLAAAAAAGLPAAGAEAGGGAAAAGAAALDAAALLRRIEELERGHQELDARCLASEARLGAAQVQLEGQGAATAEGQAGQEEFHDALVAFFNCVKALAARVLRPILLSDAAFYAAILMVLQWHARFHLGELIHDRFWRRYSSLMQRHVKPMLMPRRLGLNILIFCVYYDDQLPFGLNAVVWHRQFVCSVGLVFVDAVVLYYAFMAVGHIVNPRPMDEKRWTDPLEEEADDGILPDKFEATNIYEDLVLNLRRVSPIWFVQMVLTSLYIEELNRSKATKQLDNVDLSYWVVAVVFQMYAGDAQVGESFNPRYWNHVLNMRPVGEILDRGLRKARRRRDSSPASPVRYYCLDEAEGEVEERELEESFKELGKYWHKVFWVVDVQFWYEWQVRRLMDWSVNSIAKSIILYTVPIMVSVEAPLDFVKDLTAVMFITTLDDMDGASKDAKEILAKLKFGIEIDRRQPKKVKLSPAETRFAEENPGRFRRLSEIVLEKWEAFLREGDPSSGSATPSLVSARSRAHD